MVETRECESCPECVGGASGKDVTCWMQTLELDRPAAPRRSSRVDLREAASIASTAEVMSHGQLTVKGDAGVNRLRALFLDRGLAAAPVVDDEGKLIGMVSEHDIVRCQTERRENGAAKVTVAEIMTPVAHSLPEHAPLAFAFGLLAASGLREAPVVKDDGRVVGTITSTDLLRWVARDLGYVLE